MSPAEPTTTTSASEKAMRRGAFFFSQYSSTLISFLYRRVFSLLFCLISLSCSAVARASAFILSFSSRSCCFSSSVAAALISFVFENPRSSLIENDGTGFISVWTVVPWTLTIPPPSSADLRASFLCLFISARSSLCFLWSSRCSACSLSISFLALISSSLSLRASFLLLAAVSAFTILSCSLASLASSFLCSSALSLSRAASCLCCLSCSFLLRNSSLFCSWAIIVLFSSF